jgi:hypothetical protein
MWLSLMMVGYASDQFLVSFYGLGPTLTHPTKQTRNFVGWVSVAMVLMERTMWLSLVMVGYASDQFLDSL